MGNFESLQKIIQYRYRNIDILRGLIMILMAIDHCFLTIYQDGHPIFAPLDLHY
jgi:uncharacterized membrane protein